MTYPASFSKDEQDFFIAQSRIMAKDYGAVAERLKAIGGDGSPSRLVPAHANVVTTGTAGSNPARTKPFIPGIYTKPKLVEPVLELTA